MKRKKEQQSHIVLQDLANQMIKISKTAETIYLDQLDILGRLDTHHVFQIDRSKRTIYLMNQHLKVEFSDDFLDVDFTFKNMMASQIEIFVMEELQFFTRDVDNHNPILMREQAEKLRQLICEQLYIWVNGQQRIAQWLNNLSVVQAEIIDHLMIKVGVYKGKLFSKKRTELIEIPNEISSIFAQLFRLEVVLGDSFLAIQPLIQSLIDLGSSAKELLPKAHFRIMGIIFPSSFSLKDYLNSQSEILARLKHAEQHSNLFGFTQLMNKDRWSKTDIFAKKNFYGVEKELWLSHLQQPLFEYPKDVNWLFKQDQSVVDWVVESIQHTSVRVTISAMSFIDCSRFHSSIILACLQHFQFSSARMFIFSCVFCDIQGKFNKNHPLKNSQQASSQNSIISPSILYLDEWIKLLAKQAKQDESIIKRVYVNLSRVMQAYMMHLQQITSHLPSELMAYILPETQKGADFIYALKRHNIQINDFRQLFYLRNHHVRESIFDSYVRDYLMHSFSENLQISKGVTWVGLFHKAVEWHHQIHKNEILEKLKSDFSQFNWTSFTQLESITFNHWQFEELTNLDRIIEESQRFHHCLASSYAEQIIYGEYVAFHMSSPHYEDHLTLGCHLRHGTLYFDQLEYPNNKKAEQLLVSVAKQFIDELNQKKNN